MLSRVAESAFWMSRYVERAENLARIIDVNLHLLLDLPMRRAEEISQDWLPLLATLGDDEVFAKANRRKPSSTAVIEFLLFDRKHPGSIVGALANARENARTIREQISTEMWEQVNRTYLWLMSKSAEQFYQRNAHEFFQRVQKSLQLFQGITDSVMFHGEGWEFIQLGRYLERADKTSRLLDDEFFLLKPDKDHPAEVVLQWHTILQSGNVRQIYQRLHAGPVDPIKASELMLLNGHVPHSVAFCVDRMNQSLRRISGVSDQRFTNAAEKLSGRLLGELTFSSINEFWDKGLHDSMDDLQSKLNDLGTAIAETYIRQPEPQIISPTSVRKHVPQVPQ